MFLWTRSVWWTRVGWILSLTVIVWGSMMSCLVGRHIGSCGLPQGLTSPNLAIELAPNWWAVLAITGPCQAATCEQGMTENTRLTDTQSLAYCTDKVQELLQQQIFDRFFIVFYASLFVYMGLLNVVFGGLEFDAPPGRGWWLVLLSRWICRLGGVAAAGLALWAAGWDWVEDNRIDDALNNIGNALAHNLLPIRDAAYHKWLLLFLAIACAAPLFAFWPGDFRRGAHTQRSRLMRVLGWLTAFEAIVAMATGVAACRYGQDQRLEDAVGSLFTTLPLAAILFMAAQYWREGTLKALERLANTRLFYRLVTIEPDDEDDD